MKKPIDRIREKVTIVQGENRSFNNNTEDIISNVKRLHLKGSLIPVICEDMYEYENPETHERQSLHSYFVEKIIDKAISKHKKIELTEKELNTIVNESNYGMSLLRVKTGEDLYQILYSSVINDNNKVYKEIGLKKEVRDFLLASNPSLIVTTNNFPILEKELQKKGYESYWCELGTKNDKVLDKKCIYHLFGEAKPNTSNWWGYNDKQLFNFLKISYSSDYNLKNLTSYIDNHISRKTLLVLGNNSPDWLFRFMLSPIYGDNIYDDGIGYYMSEGVRVEDDSLEQFLHEIKFEKESQLIEVLKSVTKKIGKKKNKNIPSCSGHGKKFDFFIAHAGEDKEFAQKIAEQMRSKGMSVWVDFENLKDGHYWERIIDGLKNSAYFMPLITEMYITKNKKFIEIKKALEKLRIEDISIDKNECLRMEKKLEGVQIELLLAEKWLGLNPQEVYSIPVLLKGSTFYEEPITTERIRNWSEDSRLLPQSLFWGLQMYEFDASSPDTFTLDWNRYK